MALNDAHRRLADAAMQVEAYRLYGKRARIPKETMDASYQATMRDDMKLRPGSPKGWYTATAETVNKVIIEVSENAVKAVFNEYKVSALDEALGLGAASAVAFAPADKGADAAQPLELSRRAMLAMAAGAGLVAVAMPSQAAADNVQYVSTVRGNVRVYAPQNAPRIIGLGAGIRG